MIKRFCERCDKTTQDGHLWCSDRDCPAEQGYPVFDSGDYVADLKVIKIIAVWRTAVLYEAARNDEPVWLKVAHRDDECESRLKRDAKWVQLMAPRPPSFMQKFFAQPRLIHLAWLPPYPNKTDKAYGEVTVGDQTRVYSVFQAIPGSLLSHTLLENPNIWHTEAAGIITTVAAAMRLALDKELVHMGLTPDMIYVDKDSEGHYRATLLDYGWCFRPKDAANYNLAQMFRLVEPSYAAPEVLAQLGAQAVTPAADAYSLGMIFYEMLAGHTGYAATAVTRDDRLRQQVIANRTALALKRPELAGAQVPAIIEQAIAPQKRFASIVDFQTTLVKVYGIPPIEKRTKPIRYYVALAIIGALLFSSVVAGLLLLLSRFFSSSKPSISSFFYFSLFT